MKNIVSAETLILECLAQTKENCGVGIKKWVAEKSNDEFRLADGTIYPLLNWLNRIFRHQHSRF